MAEFDGEGDWASRLPLLLVRSWGTLPDHQLTDEEKATLRKRFLDSTLRSLDQQSSQLSLALDKKRLLGALPATEPAATAKALEALAAKVADARAGKVTGVDPPKSLAFKAVWATGRDLLPWAAADGPTLADLAQAFYTVTGSFRSVGGYLSVQVRLFSNLENRYLSHWEGRFAPDEAGDKMAEAADELRKSLLGRPWAGLSVTSTSTGAQVKVGEAWHLLPWSSDDLEPGSLELVFQQPGRAD